MMTGLTENKMLDDGVKNRYRFAAGRGYSPLVNQEVMALRYIRDNGINNGVDLGGITEFIRFSVNGDGACLIYIDMYALYARESGHEVTLLMTDAFNVDVWESLYFGFYFSAVNRNGFKNVWRILRAIISGRSPEYLGVPERAFWVLCRVNGLFQPKECWYPEKGYLLDIAEKLIVEKMGAQYGRKHV